MIGDLILLVLLKLTCGPGCPTRRTPSVIDYHSDVQTYALAFSPTSTQTNLRLAVGSFVDIPPSTSSSSSATSSSPSPANTNNLTVIKLDPAYADLEDDYDDPPNTPGSSSNGRDGFARNRRGDRVNTAQGGFVAEARAAHPYPPSAVAFNPTKLSGQLQSSVGGTSGDIVREMVASSAECLRLWDLVGDESGAGSSGGFVGTGRGGGGSRLVQRAMLANVGHSSLIQIVDCEDVS